MYLRKTLTALALCAILALPAFGAEEMASDPAMKTLLQPVAPSAPEAKALQPGASLPDVTIETMDGKMTSLPKALGGKPTALVFYRGGWCPFCNRHLSALREAQEPLSKMGYQIVAISPDTPEDLKKTMMKDELMYTLLSDPKMDAARAFGIAFEVGAETVKRYSEHGIHLDRSDGMGHNWLPVPAVFLIDSKGKIAFTHSDPDYKKRLGNEELLAAAKKAMAGS